MCGVMMSLKDLSFTSFTQSALEPKTVPKEEDTSVKGGVYLTSP